jgi:hypothetical protein
MKLNQFDIVSLASMICGDHPYKNKFPYRNTEKLSVFFQEIGLNYSYDKTSQRKKWVETVLTDLNEKSDLDDHNLSVDMKTVVRGMLNPNDYTNLYYSDLDKAKKLLEKLLKQHNIKLSEIFESDTNTTVRTKREFASKKVDHSMQDNAFIKIIPNYFSIPNKSIEFGKVSVMMPFSKEFQEIYETIKSSCESVNMQCYRADDIWNNSIIIQDIFELIFTSEIVIADFTTRNPNVFYEVGIAHTLGKHVIPIVQNISDIPFDLHHHRVLVYHNNNEGREELKKGLTARLITLKDESSLKK